MFTRIIECSDIGFVRYRSALKWQKFLAEKRRRDEIADTLLFLEHLPPVFTFGRRDASSDLLVSKDWLRENGMEIYKTDRGGRVTYHGPGQLVGYFIFALKEPIPTFVRRTEEAIIQLLSHFHLEGERDKQYPGVWIGLRKISALGFHVERGITTHGFSLNVSCNLKPFSHIHPCGIKDREVTSLEKELGWRPSMRDVKDLLLEEISKAFHSNIAVGRSSSRIETE